MHYCKIVLLCGVLEYHCILAPLIFSPLGKRKKSIFMMGRLATLHLSLIGSCYRRDEGRFGKGGGDEAMVVVKEGGWWGGGP